MKKLTITCMALAAIVVFGQTAKAAPTGPITLTLSTDAGITLFISTIGGAVSAIIDFDVTGSLTVAFDDEVPASASISILDAAIDLSDETLSLALGFLGSVDGALTGLGINAFSSAGPIAMTETGTLGFDPFTSTFDPGGGSPTTLDIDEGVFTYLGAGPIGGLLGSGTVDFGAAPISATIDPVGQVGLVTQTIAFIGGGSTIIDVVVSAPLTFADTVLTDPLVVDIDLSGALVATGSYTIVPEPSTLVLLGIAFVGLVPLWRRMRK